MVICQELRVGFIHIPKAAGSSIRQAMLENLPNCYHEPVQNAHRFGVEIRNWILGPEGFDRLRWFAVTRHPVEAIWSSYQRTLQIATGRKGKRYRYYTCTHAIKCGRKACPSGYLSAEDIERIVVDRIRGIAKDKQLGAEVVRQAQTLVDQELADLKTERRDLERELARHHVELGKLSVESLGSPSQAFRLADLHNLIGRAETRLNEVRNEIKERNQQQLDPQDIAAAFGDFDATWNALSPRERVQALSLLVARVDYDATDTSIAVTFHSSTITSLAARQREEAA